MVREYVLWGDVARIAREKNLSYRVVYNEVVLKRRGFNTSNDYQKYLLEKRRKRQKNKDLSSLIRKRKEELRKSNWQIARQIGCSRWAMALFSRGDIIPKEKNLRKLYFALEIDKYNILDEKDFIRYFRNKI